jgi:uncharacterized protein (TIGR03067 family)
MRRIIPIALIVPCIVMALLPITRGGDDAKDSLQGVWVAQSMEVDGKAVPVDVVKRLRFTFKGDKLFLKGNFDDDREDECPYKIDPKQSPKHLDFSPPKEKKPILGIYDVKGDELKVCLRHADSSAGRPTEFTTKADSKLMLIFFKKQKP